MYNGQERRKFKRKEKQYMARFKVRSGETQEMESYDWHSVFLMNISGGGIFFHYTKDLGIGTLLDLKIYVPNAVNVINCVVKVIRIDKPWHTSVFCIAIEFTDIGEQEKEAINTAVEEALEQANKTSLG